MEASHALAFFHYFGQRKRRAVLLLMTEQLCTQYIVLNDDDKSIFNQFVFRSFRLAVLASTAVELTPCFEVCNQLADLLFACLPEGHKLTQNWPE